MARIFIGDGYDVSARFDSLEATGERLNLSPLAIKYRPCLPERLEEYRFVQRNSGKDSWREKVKLILEHVGWWDAEDRDGNAAPVPTEALLAKTPPPYIDWMIKVVSSYGTAQAHADVKNSFSG